MRTSRLAELSEALGLGPDPERVLGPLRRLYGEVDAAIARAADGLGLPCGSGCSECCHESVFLSAPEFLAVAAALLDRPPEVVQEIRIRMLALAHRFEDELELLETLPAGTERDEVAARVRFRCPLLGEDERCTVYEARELNARTFGQSRDGLRGEPYGCARTHERLRVLGAASSGLPDARAVRRALAERLPGTERVHVYPWWFKAYGHLLG